MTEISREVEMLATALHLAEDDIGEVLCWCRRISTADMTIDGEQDEDWSHDGAVYDPAEWGVSAERPTYCEKAAMKMLGSLPKPWGLAMLADPIELKPLWEKSLIRASTTERERLWETVKPLLDALPPGYGRDPRFAAMWDAFHPEETR